MNKEEKIKEEDNIQENNQQKSAEETPEHKEDNAKAEQPTKRDKKKRHDKSDGQTEKLQEMGEKLAEANDKYVRLYSEYENYRKRSNAEKAELIVNGGKEVLKAILPVADDMERALQAMPDDSEAKEGVQLIYSKMMGILAQKGVKPIDAKGQKFDENLHEAVTQIPAPDESLKGCVVDVVLQGYYINDKVLRYAKVVVGA